MRTEGAEAVGRRMLTVADVAGKVGVSSRKIWRMISDPGIGFPRPVRIGSRGTRWCSDEIEAFLARLAAERGGRS
jgi:predicted DNA-binding transcriptional regulator AlpA